MCIYAIAENGASRVRLRVERRAVLSWQVDDIRPECGRRLLVRELRPFGGTCAAPTVTRIVTIVLSRNGRAS